MWVAVALVFNKMWSIKVCFFLVAYINVLYVQALPTGLNLTAEDPELSSGRFKVLECPENEFLNHEGKACEATCENPISLSPCTEEKVIACQCDDGYLRNSSGICVKADKCEYGMPENAEKTLSASHPHGNVLTIDAKPNDELENIHPDNQLGDDELEQLEADLYIRNVIDSLIDDVVDAEADADESFEYSDSPSEKASDESQKLPFEYVDLKNWEPHIF